MFASFSMAMGLFTLVLLSHSVSSLRILKDTLGLLAGDVCLNGIDLYGECDPSLFLPCSPYDCGCNNDDDDMYYCDESWSSECGLCMRRTPIPEEIEMGHSARFYIEYDAVQCLPRKWNCNMCLDGRWCESEGRCVQDSTGEYKSNRYKCQECGWKQYCGRYDPPTSTPTEGPSSPSTPSPSLTSTLTVTEQPSPSPTEGPSKPSTPPQLTVTRFVVTSSYPGGVDDGDGTNMKQYVERLTDKTANTDFLVHLGDFLKEDDDCQQIFYSDFAYTMRRYSKSSVFLIPGDAEWNNCPNPDIAWEYWNVYLGHFDRNWEDQTHTLNVLRQETREENFAFLNNGALFIGLRIVGEDDSLEYTKVLQGNMDWLRRVANLYWDRFQALLIFGNDFGDLRSLTQRVFATFVEDVGVPTVYVHTSESSFGVVKREFDLDNLTRVRLQANILDFVTVVVDVDQIYPFQFEEHTDR